MESWRILSFLEDRIHGDYGKKGDDEMILARKAKPFGGKSNIGKKWLAGTMSGLLTFALLTLGIGSNVANAQTTPGGINKTPHLWLRADQGVVTANGKVTAWKDQSGNNLDFSQNNVANQPEFNDDSKRLNFNKAVKFDGTSSFLVNENGVTGANTYNNFNVFVVSGIGNTTNSLFWEEIYGSGGRLNVHLPWSGIVFWDAGSQQNERVKTATVSATLGKYYIWNFNYGITGSGDDGQSLYRDGKELVSPVSRTNPVKGINKKMTLGSAYTSDGSTASFYNGQVGELIFYTAPLTAQERQQIDSYLAIKYGVSLDNIDYLDAHGNVIWQADANYNSNIAGIARDDVPDLYQKQSRSTNDQSKLTIGIGAQLSEKNEAITETLTDKQSLIWGDNGHALTFTKQIGTTNKNHAERIWKVQNTGNVGEVLIAIPDSELPANASLVVGGSDTDFGTATEYPLTKVTFDGITYVTTKASLADGQFFTFAAPAPKVENATLEQTQLSGDDIVLTFDQNLQVTSLAGFIIKVDGTPITVSSFKVDTNDPKKLILTLPAGTDITGKTVSVDYDGLGNVTGSLDGKKSVPANQFSKVVTTAPALTIDQPAGTKVFEAKPEFKGTATAGSTVAVQIKDNNGTVIDTPTVTVNPDGTWSFTPTSNLPDGDYTVEVTATKDGKSTPVTKSITVDATAPALTIDQPAGTKVFEAKPEFKGTATAGSTVAVQIKDNNGTVIDTPTVTVNPDGTWSFTPTTDLTDGDYTVEVTATKDGKSTTETKAITVDTTAPAVTIDQPAGTKVFEAKPAFKGTATAGSTVAVQIKDKNGTVIDTPTVTVNPDGTWSFTPTSNLPDGDYTVEVTATKDGKSTSVTKAITVDATAPAVTIDQPAGTKVFEAKPEFKGTATTGSTVAVQIKDKNGTVIDTPMVTVNPDGTWSFTPTSNLSVGDYTVEVTATKDGKTTTTTKNLTVSSKTPPLPVVDKTALQAKVDQIHGENLVASEYTSSSWASLETAMQQAETVLKNPNATQQEVDEALSALKNAYNGLEKVSAEIDKSKLQAKVDQINDENLVADDYTDESWTELEKALQQANAVLKDPKATQKEVDAALAALTKAREGLKKQDDSAVDKSKLQAKVDAIQAENLKAEEYTKASWQALQGALAHAQAVLADPKATQKEVDAALSALKKARQGLEKQDDTAVDKSKLEAKVIEVQQEELDEDDYTASSWRKLEKALKHAKDVLADPNATQDEVDEALVELKKARRDLVDVQENDGAQEKDRDDSIFVSDSFFSSGSGNGNAEQQPSVPGNGEEAHERTGYMNGYPSGDFDPDRPVTRAEMASILINTGMVKPETSAAGSFFDVADHNWAADAIKRANEAGLMNGYANGMFNPGGGITRAEMAAIVYKYLGLSGNGMPNNFSDVSADNWATPIIAAVSEAGLMSGYPDGTFQPQKILTRAEAVAIINRLLNKIQLSPVNGQTWPDVPPTHWAYKDIEAATKK
ncbi:MAG: Ig-like domain-containing protein [Clostridia bacterium]